MTALRTKQSASDLVQDLREDLLTRWAPDLINDADIEEQVKLPAITADELSLSVVPKVRGAERSVAQLSARALAALREAVAEVREVSDAWLDPAVCGYRRGASGENAYSEEYRRFREFSHALADSSGFVLTADIADFFPSVDMSRIHGAISAGLGREKWAPVENFLERISKHGVLGIPAGYGDARLIANLILGLVDRSITSPFTRWIDDYRVFVRTQAEAARELEQLSAALLSIGLHLNYAKVHVLTTTDFVKSAGRPLDSVYHPGDDTTEVTRAGLRTAFLEGASLGKRRLVRFALPRLAEQGDDIALDFCLARLAANDIDAPRMAQYTARFVDSVRVRNFLENKLTSLQPWSLSRVLPLLVSRHVERANVSWLCEQGASEGSSVVADLATRILSSNGYGREVKRIVSSCRALKPRTVLIAYADLGFPIDEVTATRAPGTYQALARMPNIPLPTAETLL